MKTFSTSTAISFGWNTFRGNWKFWLIAYLIAFGAATPNLNFTKSIENNRPDKVEQKLQDISKDSVLPSNIPSSDSILGLSTTAGETNPASKVNVGSPFKKFMGLLIILIPWGLVAIAGILFLAILIAGIGTVFKMGYIHLALDAVRGNPIEYKTLLSDVSIKKALNLLLLDFLFALLVFFGFILFIIPGIYFALKYMFAPTVFVDKNTKVLEAFSLSAEITKGNKFKLLGYSIMSVLIFVLGFLCFFVGVIPAGIVITLAMAKIYVSLQDTPSPAPTA